MHVLRAVVVDSDGVLQRLDAGLQTEGDLGVSYRVPAEGNRYRVMQEEPSSCDQNAGSRSLNTDCTRPGTRTTPMESAVVLRFALNKKSHNFLPLVPLCFYFGPGKELLNVNGTLF